jgi:hypothetical protein
MNTINLMDVNQFIHGGMAQYYQQRIEFLKNLKLDQIIVEVNPYLLRVKNDRWVSALIEKTLGHFLLSSEETHFSEFLGQRRIIYRGYPRWTRFR